MSRECELLGPEIVAVMPKSVTLDADALHYLAGYVGASLRRQGWTEGDISTAVERRRNPEVRVKLDRVEKEVEEAVTNGKVSFRQVEEYHRDLSISIGLFTKDSQFALELAFVRGTAKLIAAGRVVLVRISANIIDAMLAQHGDVQSAIRHAYDPDAPHNQN